MKRIEIKSLNLDDLKKNHQFQKFEKLCANSILCLYKEINNCKICLLVNNFNLISVNKSFLFFFFIHLKYYSSYFKVYVFLKWDLLHYKIPFVKTVYSNFLTSIKIFPFSLPCSVNVSDTINFILTFLNCSDIFIKVPKN